MLRLPTIRAQFPELAEAAARDQMSYRGFLAELLMAECDRARRRSERRIKAAQFPREKSLRAFDCDANPRMGQEGTAALPERRGTGKSHLLITLGTEAAMAGFRGPLHTGHQAGQRAGRSRGREDPDQDHRPLRARRSPLHRRTRLHGAGPQGR
ncbi:ATP-binding protein [Streptomyces massasporeus]|uniref:ATP-binding protein n=1 Tax=Streptomyces massasporeus TaxID=67324 RepID=UPI0036794799